MKSSKYIILLGIILSSCKKNIDLYPLSNSTVQTYYSNTSEVQTALVGAYNGMQKPLLEEWKLTELRSDNTLMGSTGTTSAPNLDLTLLDIFTPPTSHQGNYNYWISSYYNIRNVNTILNSLSINYNDTSGVLNYDNLTIPVSDADRKNIAAEATFIRAYHYFNLVRLYGGVFLIHEPIDPIAATLVNRTSVSQIYKLIIADLKNSVAFGNATKFTSIASANLGRANKWCAEALLAKAYLSTGVASDKALAIPLLQDVIANSGYSLQISYPNIFSTSNEMNSEIMFAIRYKAGGLGLGSTFPNTFAPENSGSAIVNGDGKGYNYPAMADLNIAYKTIETKGQTTKDSSKVVLTLANTNVLPGMYVSGSDIQEGTKVTSVVGTTVYISLPVKSTSIVTNSSIIHFDKDLRKVTNIGFYSPSNAPKYYPKKLVSPVTITNDAENDWVVLRYADVLLMLAEAQGNIPASLTTINLFRNRAGATPLVSTDVATTAQFEAALATERRLEFAFENNRWFDILRFNLTLPSQDAVTTMKAHFSTMWTTQYSILAQPNLNSLGGLPTLQGYANTNKLLLPIPQREIDNNTTLVIPQNPGY